MSMTMQCNTMQYYIKKIAKHTNDNLVYLFILFYSIYNKNRKI